MRKVTTAEFEKELQTLDPRLSIVPNGNRPGAANVYLNGVDVCPWLPQFQMQDEHTPDYTYQFRDMTIPFKTTEEVKEVVSILLGKLEDKEYVEALFDTPLPVTEEAYGEHKV